MLHFKLIIYIAYILHGPNNGYLIHMQEVFKLSSI